MTPSPTPTHDQIAARVQEVAEHGVWRPVGASAWVPVTAIDLLTGITVNPKLERLDAIQAVALLEQQPSECEGCRGYGCLPHQVENGSTARDPGNVCGGCNGTGTKPDPTRDQL